MGRNKTKIQKDIQAFKYKQTVANVTWEQAAMRYGTKALSVKRINTLYNALEKSGYAGHFDAVVNRFELGMTIAEWLLKHTSTFSGALKQLRAYVENQEVETMEPDITEFNPETGVKEDIEQAKPVIGDVLRLWFSR